MSKLQNFVFFASNDGGHFSELIALHKLFPKYRSVIVTDKAGANKSIPELSGVEAIEFATAFARKREELAKNAPPKGSEKKLTILDYLGCFPKLFIECYSIWSKYRPKVVVTTGSNIAVPLCLISKLKGTKFVYIETRAKVYSKTLSGRLVEKFSDKIIVQWPEMVSVYNGKAQYLGTLV